MSREADLDTKQWETQERVMARHAQKIAELEAQRDEADRRAGAAERELSYHKDRLPKRIAELEARITNTRAEAQELDEALAGLVAQLTYERQRREEAEATLQEIASAPNRIAENVCIIAAHFRKYEPGK